MDAVRQELGELRALILRQQERIAELEARAAKGEAGQEPGGTPTRRGVLFGAAAALGGVAYASEPASAANGSPLVCGSATNSATASTMLQFTPPDSLATGFVVGDDLSLAPTAYHSAIAALNEGDDTSRYALYGHSTGTAALTVGDSWGMFAIGWEETGVTSFGGSRGVLGYSSSGIGVHAQGLGPTSTALVVDGVLRVKRAGRVVVPAGQRQRRVQVNGPVTSSSIVLATPQRTDGRVAVTGAALDPPDAFTLWLSQPAPTGGLPIGWVIVDMIGAALDGVAVRHVSDLPESLTKPPASRRRSRAGRGRPKG